MIGYALANPSLPKVNEKNDRETYSAWARERTDEAIVEGIQFNVVVDSNYYYRFGGVEVLPA